MAVLYLNLINWEIAEVKSAMEFNGGFSLLYTPVKDSVSNKNSVNQWGAVSGMPFMEIKFLIKPDTRYGFSLFADLGWLFLWDTRLKMINDPMNPTDSKSYNRELYHSGSMRFTSLSGTLRMPHFSESRMYMHSLCRLPTYRSSLVLPLIFSGNRVGRSNCAKPESDMLR